MQNSRSTIDKMDKINLQNNDVLINQNDNVDKIFFLISGKISVIKDDIYSSASFFSLPSWFPEQIKTFVFLLISRIIFCMTVACRLRSR